MDEKQFWKTTPRKLFALLKAHNRANSAEEAEEKKPDKMKLEDLLALQTGGG